jgi:uncharacterized protein with HEPN domain
LSFREPELLLRDISGAIGLIEEFTAGMDFDAFQQDAKTVAAVERELQVLSEAATRLGGEAEARYPGLPRRDMRGMGNWLRHQYERIELPVIWETVTEDLPALKSAVLRALSPPSADAMGPSPG